MIFIAPLVIFYLLQYEISVVNCSFSVKKTYLNQEAVAACRSLSAVAAVLFTRATSQKSVLARDLALLSASGALATTETECRGRDNLRNSRSVFRLVFL